MGINSLIEDAIGLAKENPVVTAIGAGVAAVGVGLGTAAIIGAATKKKTRKSSTKRGRKRDARFKSKQKHEQRYKRKRKYKIYGRKGYINPKSSKRRGKVYYARKTGQPYIILASGKAKFIKGKRRKK